MNLSKPVVPAGSGLYLIGDTGIALGRPADGQAHGVWEDVGAVLDCSLSPLIRRAPCRLVRLLQFHLTSMQGYP